MVVHWSSLPKHLSFVKLGQIQIYVQLQKEKKKKNQNNTSDHFICLEQI